MSMIVLIEMTRENAVIPKIQTQGSGGSDLYACEGAVIEPGETKMIPLGFKTAFSPNYVGLIYARSGLAAKAGLAPANKVGVIDSDYRGEWMVALHNQSNTTQTVHEGDRIAQVLFQPVEHPSFIEVKHVDNTERGEGGFNSTGTK